jgi:hypothetical protein
MLIVVLVIYMSLGMEAISGIPKIIMGYGVAKIVCSPVGIPFG